MYARGARGWRHLDSALAVAGPAVLILVLLLLIPPHGILSENEEDYFALAHRFVSGSAWPEKTAVFDASPHRMLSDLTLGAVVSAIGYAPAQVVTRLLAVAGYALTLSALFRVVGLSTLDAAIAVMGTELIGQDIIGGEWLFSGYEAKVAAYVLVLAGLRLMLARRQSAAAALLFAVATWFHFLVGGFWFLAAMALRLLDSPRELRQVARMTALYALLVAPLLGVIAWARLADTSATGLTDMPPPDVIYAIIREPHHQSPFLSWAYFRAQWLPGYVMALPMLLVCVWVAWRHACRRLRVMALWVAGLLTYLVVILGPKLLDRDTGMLGKLYLFRPSALTLLLWLLLALAVLVAMLGSRAWFLRAALVAVAAPAFLWIRGGQLVREIADNDALMRDKQPFVAAVTRVVAPGDVVLIDPEVEMQWLDFERRTSRPTFVAWKFAPTNDAELIKWYRRIEFRREVFEQGCAPDMHAEGIAYLLTTPVQAPILEASCGPEVLRGGPWVLLRRVPPNSSPA
ncbi:MAG: hypothetical protein JO227_24145 [Acetobacteraceae bacterium]|nr:hypothetical protein [Acetobacteraceae bacterium]